MRKSFESAQVSNVQLVLRRNFHEEQVQWLAFRSILLNCVHLCGGSPLYTITAFGGEETSYNIRVRVVGQVP